MNKGLVDFGDNVFIDPSTIAAVIDDGQDGHIQLAVIVFKESAKITLAGIAADNLLGWARKNAEVLE